MTQTKKLVVIAGAALSLGASAFAQSANQDNGRAYAAELVSDAGARVSLLDGGTGYNKNGFAIGSADGNNSLYVFGSAQIRYYADFRKQSDADPTVKSFTHGFENRETRLGVKGSVWDKDFTYQIRGQFGNDGNFGLETAFAHYQWDNGFGIMAGQFKHPLFRESLVDNEYQLAVERSVTEGLFAGGYSQGVQFTYKSDQFRGWFGFTDGLNSANTSFNGGTNRAFLTDTGEADYAVNARVEFKAMGNSWERFDDFTSWKSAEDTGLLLGGAVHWQDTGESGGTSSNPKLQNLTYTLDAQFEGQGFNAFAAFLGTHQDTDVSGSEATDDFGIVAQGGVFVTDQVEVFARWDSTFFDNARNDSNGDKLKDAHFITFGANYYLSPESHAAKLSADLIWSLQKTPGLFQAGDATATPPVSAGPLNGNSNYGILGQPKDGEVALRAQLQVVF
jgi:hypothetical protein